MIIADKKITKQDVKSASIKPKLKGEYPKHRQTSEKNLKTEFSNVPANHSTKLNTTKTKKSSKKTQSAKQKTKINEYINSAVSIQKIPISDHDEKIYKKAQKLRIEELEQIANQKNKIYFAQLEYEEKLNSTKRRTKNIEKHS